METATHHSSETRQGAEASAAKFPPLHLETRTHVPTDAAAYYLLRETQTLRGWACLETGPLRPLHVHGRLLWPVAEIKRLLGVV